MAGHEIILPALSAGMTEATVARWTKRIGDRIAVGDVLADVETDKATIELVAEAAGTLAEAGEDGQTFAVGTVIGRIASGASILSSHAGSSGAKVSVHRIPRSSPLARRFARDRAIDLSTVAGSGPGGRVVRRDVERLVLAAVEASPMPPHPDPSMPATTARLGRDILHLGTVCDAAALIALREQIRVAGRTSVGLTDLLVKAAGTAYASTSAAGETVVGVASWEGELALGDVLGTTLSVLADRRRMGRPEVDSRTEICSVTLANLGRCGVCTMLASDLPRSGCLLVVGTIDASPDAIGRRLPLSLSVSPERMTARDAVRFLASIRTLVEAPLQLLA